MKTTTLQKLQDLYNMPNATQKELSDEAFKRSQILYNKTIKNA